MEKYIVDGEFLRDKLEADLAEYHETSARAGCKRAPYRTDALVFSATAEQLEALPPEDLTSWHFSLYSDELKGAEVSVTMDDTELWVIN